MRRSGSIRHRMLRAAALVAGIVAAVAPVAGAAEFSLDFGVAPRLDATFTSFLGGTVAYDAAWYSSLSVEYGTERDEQSEQLKGYSAATSMEASSFSVDLDLIGLNLLQGSWRLGVAGSAEFIQFGALEDALYTADDGFVMVGDSQTLGITNDRSLQILLPTIDVRFRGSAGPLYLALGGEYSPMIFVFLDQTLSTDPVLAGITDDGPIRSAGVYQSQQSFSVNGAFRLTTDVLAPELSAEYTRLPIAYTAASLEGEREFDTVINELAINGNVGFTFMNVFGFHPTLQTSFERSWIEIAGQRDAVPVDEWLFYLGARRNR